MQGSPSHNTLVRQLAADLTSATFVYLVLAWMPGLILLLLINESESADIPNLSSVIASPENAVIAAIILLTPLVIIGVLAFYMRLGRKLNDPRGNRIWSDHLTSMSMNFWVLEIFLAVLWTIRLASLGRTEVLDGNLGLSFIMLLADECLFLVIITLPISLKTYKLISKVIERTGDATTIQKNWELHLQKTTAILTVWSIALVALLSAETLAHPRTESTFQKLLGLAPAFWLPLLLLVPLSYAFALSDEFPNRKDKPTAVSKRSIDVIEGVPVYLVVIFFVFLVAPMCWMHLTGDTSPMPIVDLVIWGTSLIIVSGLALFFVTYFRTNAR